MKKANVQRQIGNRIKELRIAAGLTQEDVADTVLSVRGYQKIEAGEVDLRVSSLLYIATVLKVKPEAILKGISPVDPYS